MSMFIYICQAPPHFQFIKKINNLYIEEKRLLYRLQLLAGGSWSFAGGLWSFASSLQWFAVVYCWFVIVCTCLWSFVVIACFSNYAYRIQFYKYVLPQRVPS